MQLTPLLISFFSIIAAILTESMSEVRSLSGLTATVVISITAPANKVSFALMVLFFLFSTNALILLVTFVFIAVAVRLAAIQRAFTVLAPISKVSFTVTLVGFRLIRLRLDARSTNIILVRLGW